MRLECLNIFYKYPGTELPILNNLTFSISEPGFHALFGPSGVGKTSLAKIISGEIAYQSGKLRLNGIDTILYSYNLERLPGWSNIGQHLKKITTPSMASFLDELIGEFGMEGLMDQRFAQLSLGQQNRVNLIRYLLQDFQLLIMDESLANVDELTREKIILKIKEHFPDRLFLYISHNVVEVAKFCRLICVFRGSHKQPQTQILRGQDSTFDKQLDAKQVESTMLEIMNAI
jgi:ABC-type multidrug transport system ATPase subunit